MVSQKTTIVNAQGFHMRPAVNFTKAMAKYKSEVKLVFKGAPVDAKSLMNIIAACIKCGSEVEVVCNGPDENDALKEAVSMIESGLGD